MSDKKDKKRESKIYEQYYEYQLPFDPEVGMDVFSEIEKAPEIEDVDDEFKKLNCYNGEIKIMNRDVDFPYTQEQMDEMEKCYDDILYFIVNYCKIITMSDGMQLFKLFQYQRNTIKVIHENRFSIFKFPRQMGKCVVNQTLINVRINGEEIDLTIGQLYDLIEHENMVESYVPNYTYQILTEDGFKDFDGITTRTVDELYEIILSNDSKIRATAKHEIKLFDGQFIKMSDLKVGDVVGVEEKNIITNINVYKGEYRVADMISVKDTHSFAVNDLSAILSNCIDGDSLVTMLDNHTGKIFQIHIDKLFDYLYAGAKHDIPDQ